MERGANAGGVLTIPLAPLFLGIFTLCVGERTYWTFLSVKKLTRGNPVDAAVSVLSGIPPPKQRILFWQENLRFERTKLDRDIQG